MAERAPLAAGVKVTVMRQIARGLTVPEPGQVLADVILKSPGFAPVRVVLVMFKAAVRLVFVRVEVLAALVVPTITEPKRIDAGRSVAVGAAVPVPVSVTT